MTPSKPQRIHIGFRQALSLLAPYIKDRLLTQIRSVWLIILYLVFFQTLILRIRIFEAAVIAVGIGLVVVGLTLFMEGLFLGLMRLGSLIGSGLPRKSPIWVVLMFALVMGFLATLAEPSIQVLQMAGMSVKPWDAPLLFLLLNRYAHYLVYAVGIGVGVAVALGMFRFYYNISLKPFIYLFVTALAGATVWASLDANLASIIGLAWDCGAVTTGPVTVPLVLALGIGVSRMVGSADSGTTGFGVVTLASLLPVVMVLALGAVFNTAVPAPMSRADFFSADNRASVQVLFDTPADCEQYRLLAAGPTSGGTPAEEAANTGAGSAIDMRGLLQRNGVAALKAIGLLTVPIFLVFFLVVRERLPHPDEILLGLLLCVAGLAVFSIGIELGLDKLGTQVGKKLPAAFKTIAIPEAGRAIDGFDPAIVQTAVSESGEPYQFFFTQKGRRVVSVPYEPEQFDPLARRYHYTPVKGPLFGEGATVPGVLLVVVFAFIMGYGATLAEPALNALGVTVEDVTAGAFRKSLLMQAVAVGVGIGIALGVMKVIFAFSLAWILVPAYLVLLLVTRLSTEDFVNIGWDSAGVTTGPITVPLVLAIGLGIGSQVGVVEGFGILAAASVCPILTVLLLGLHVNRKQRDALAESADGDGRKS
ncbi:DUF1538 domain-containing protein [Desulfosudis oleivorans]|uniref:DUF1538 domain-containing protein n=1 Tax=Desulfosudis oleivorans (strain DSM 6200 / JCM 39069 / Hxd3) TaxID=96561 RepID=A8ZVJ5_DESOH|nr:DUF1538 domain-containing protein [Desulfosudis oleivorans]ABW68182.1 protein of unknown function DUF1538 [Desulfosudis oleivorans Hxd3]